MYTLDHILRAQSEIRAVALLLARQLSSIFLYIYIMPLHALPSDVTTVIHDFCGSREIGYSLGCSGKAWRPTDAVWKRLASRHPLTRLAVKYVSSKYAGWCAAYASLRSRISRLTILSRRSFTQRSSPQLKSPVESKTFRNAVRLCL